MMGNCWGREGGEGVENSGKWGELFIVIIIIYVVIRCKYCFE